MNQLILSFVVLALAAGAPVRAEAPVADLDTAVRCGALFGILHAEQQRGVASALQYPSLERRGKEFFVRTAARLMDERHLTREQVGERFRAETRSLQEQVIVAADPEKASAQIAAPCFSLLDATIPQK